MDEMINEIKLPQLGQTMEEGTIVTVLIHEGDLIEKGDVVFEIETDKATLEMESPAGGYVKKILVEQGQTVPVNAPLMILGDMDEDVDLDPAASAVSQNSAESAAVQQDAKGSAVKERLAGRCSSAGKTHACSPRARKTAQELGVDIDSISLTPGASRITEADVLKTAKTDRAHRTPAPTCSLGQKVPASRLQKIVAEKMVQSKREIPCFYLNIQADVTDLVNHRQRYNKVSDVKISYNDYLICAVSMGLQKFPVMTGQYIDGSICTASQIDIGLAVSTDEGLVAPVIKGVAHKKIKEIAICCQELIARAKANKLSLDDLKGGVITISNLGSCGIRSFIPIVVPGQTAILGIGQIADTCVPMEGNILVRKMIDMTLAVDHKVVNGVDAAMFLNYVKQLLENPELFNR